jgi:signal transduction histidine kinase
MSHFAQITSIHPSKPFYLVNLLSLIFSGLAIGLSIILYALFGWSPTLLLIFLVAILFWLVILLNNRGYDRVGRLLFCLVPIWLTLLTSIIGKFENSLQSYIIYFDSRYILLATSILPGIVFDFKEKVALAVCLGSTFICLMLFDPIHNMMGVGYYQRGFDTKSYYYINYITAISLAALVSGVFILKWKHQLATDEALKALAKNLEVTHELQDSNHEMQALTEEMEAQNEELVQQQEELMTSQEAIAKANEVIAKQAQDLEKHNKHLEELIEEKSGDLLKTNQELIQSNNELRQFSFSVSHNLRGPVARLLGLTSLVQLNQSPADLDQSIQFIRHSAQELDNLLHDLSTIIDIRSDLYRVREKVRIEEKWQRCLALVGQEALGGIDLQTDFQERFVFGIRPMILSIFYNLVSNSIKYRSDKPVMIKVRSYASITGQTIIEVTDNGLGINLEKQGKDLFKLYKRFHVHVPGKGLGLYLVRTQMEINGGRVEVESQPNQGTTFRLVFPVLADMDKQVFFENDSAQLYYDAHINNTVIIWKKNVTSAEYRAAFESVLQTIEKYNTPGWIADLRNQGAIDSEDQRWFVENVLRVAAHKGLKRIAAIGFDDPMRKEYYKRMTEKTNEFGINMRVFQAMNQAVDWMKPG